jgi:uncharacterized protein YxjI
MGLRGRRQERHGDGHGHGMRTYRMRQRLASIGDDFWIEDEGGNRAYKVDGKAMRLRKTMVFEDAGGHALYKIQERKLRIHATMEIEDAGGNTVATVKKALITPLRERFDVHVEGGQDLEVQGNVVDHEYRISAGRDKVAEVSKKWFRIADTYGVEVDGDQDQALVLAIAAVVDSMTHQSR